MQRRVMDLGGSLSMKRRAPKGMCMTVTIPWEGELGSA
jgi:signal transduction histidine kinase